MNLILGLLNIQQKKRLTKIYNNKDVNGQSGSGASRSRGAGQTCMQRRRLRMRRKTHDERMCDRGDKG